MRALGESGTRQIGCDGHFHITVLGAFLSDSSGSSTNFRHIGRALQDGPVTVTVGEHGVIFLDSFFGITALYRGVHSLNLD
jgi:hypothetical protein